MLNGESVVDAFHCNAIDVDETTGNLLVSMRHTNAVFYVDKASKVIQWKLGGAAYNKDGAQLVQVTNDPDGTFSMQHDARFLPNGNISMFDDHGASPGYGRGVEYAVDLSNGTASVVWQYLGTAQSQLEGSCRRYADGETVIGWGGDLTDPRTMTEVDPNGDDVLDLTVTGISYRAVKVSLTQLDIGLLRANAGQ
jgi:Arylsulfotransferase (ASST)